MDQQEIARKARETEGETGRATTAAAASLVNRYYPFTGGCTRRPCTVPTLPRTPSVLLLLHLLQRICGEGRATDAACARIPGSQAPRSQKASLRAAHAWPVATLRTLPVRRRAACAPGLAGHDAPRTDQHDVLRIILPLRAWAHRGYGQHVMGGTGRGA